jgi:hypothetical protein
MKKGKSDLGISQHYPKYHNLKLFAVNEKEGQLDLYLSFSGGSMSYLTSHRYSGLLWLLLKDGTNLDQLRRLKPSDSPRTQKTYETVQHLLKIVDSFLQFEYEFTA